MFGCRQNSNRIGFAKRAQVRAFQRIHGNIDAGMARIIGLVPASADLLTDIEHRRLVALPLADDDRAVDWQRVHFLAHGLDRDLIGLVPVPLPHRVGAGDSCLLHYAQEVEGEIGIDRHA